MDPEPEELAALVAAIERFLLDTAPAPAPAPALEPPSPWVRAARLEAVGETDPHPAWPADA